MATLILLAKGAWGFLSKLPWWLYVAAALLVYHFAAIAVAEHRATAECDAKWQKKEAASEAQYQTDIAKLKQQAKDQEASWQTKITEVGVQYANDLQAQQDQSSRDVADARAGALKLRVRSSCVQAGGSGGTKTSPDPGQSQPAGICELPPEVTGRLYALADDANRVTKKFNGCLAILQAERK